MTLLDIATALALAAPLTFLVVLAHAISRIPRVSQAELAALEHQALGDLHPEWTSEVWNHPLDCTPCIKRRMVEKIRLERAERTAIAEASEAAFERNWRRLTVDELLGALPDWKPGGFIC